jgi:hypothetical protein
LNVRADDETEERIARLLPVVSAALGLKVTMSDLFRLGMIELERKYAPTSAAQPAEGDGQASKGKAQRKGKGS